MYRFIIHTLKSSCVYSHLQLDLVSSSHNTCARVSRHTTHPNRTMFAIPAPVASDVVFHNTHDDDIVGVGTLIVRPTSGRGQNAEVIDLHAARYASDLGSRKTHSVSDLLSNRIEQIFSTASSKPKLDKIDARSHQPPKSVPDFPVLGNPVTTVPIPKWCSNFTTLSRDVNEKIGRDNVDELDFREREKNYIEDIFELKRTIKSREDILDEIDLENAGLRAKVDNVERELAWYRDN